jgi:hypothetical protein
MTPVFTRHARRVNFAATNLKPLAIEKKIIGVDGECVFGRSGLGVRNGQQYHGENKKLQ